MRLSVERFQLLVQFGERGEVKALVLHPFGDADVTAGVEAPAL